MQPQRLVFAIVAPGAALATLDQFVVNVAVAAISRSLHGSIPAVSWVLNGYSIAFAALLVPMGRLADRSGRKPGFLAGIALFTMASVACAMSSTLAQLIAARVIQAAGAALLVPSSLGLLLAAHPAERRAGAVRAWAATIAASAVLGPVVGGLLITVSWRCIFLINVPIGIGVIIFGARMLAAAPAERGPLPDFPGAVLIALGVAALSLGLVKAQDWGWTSARVIGIFVVSWLATGAFVLRCRRHRNPIVELSLLQVPRFGLATAALIAYGAAYASALLPLTLWVQTGWGWSPLRFGLAFVPGPLMVPLLSPWTGAIISRIGAGATAAIGCLIFAASGVVRLVLIGETPDYPSAMLPVLLLSGLGIALALPTITSAGSASLPPPRFATGSGVLNMARQLGFTVGVAIAVAVLGREALGHAGLPAFRHSTIVTTVLGTIAAAAAIQLARHENRGIAAVSHPEHMPVALGNGYE